MKKLIIFILLLLLSSIVANAQTVLVETGTYVGDGQNNRSVTVAFNPKMVIIWNTDDNLNSVVIAFSSMPQNYGCQPHSGSGIETGFFDDCGSLAFTVDNHAQTNSNTVNYCYLAVGGDSVYSSTYVGNNSERDVTDESMGFKPAFGMIISPHSYDPVYKTDALGGDSSIVYLGNFSASTVLEGLIQNGFHIGNADIVNEADSTFYYVAIESDSAIWRIPTYRGTGGDDRNLTGYSYGTPTWACISPGSATNIYDDVWKHEINDDADVSYQIDCNVRADAIQDFISGGIQLGTYRGVNYNTEYYTGFAFKDVVGSVSRKSVIIIN